MEVIVKLNKIIKILLFIVPALFAGCEITYPTGSSGSGNYTIYFDTQGGDYCPLQNGYYGDEIRLPLPYKPGYSFYGWYSSSSGGIRYGAAGDMYRITSSTTMYAQWGTFGHQTYTIYFDAQGGTTANSYITANSGDVIILPSASKTGYYLNGWYSMGGIYCGKAGDTYTVYSDMNLYADWDWGTCSRPIAPTGLYASVLSGNAITISWNTVIDAEYYEVYRSDNSNGNYAVVGKAYSTSYTDNSGVSGSTYYYKVKAVNSCGGSDFSNYTYAMIPLNKTGTLVIENMSYSFNLKEVYIGSINHGSISARHQRSFELDAGTYTVSVTDDYGDGDSYSASVSVTAGQTQTLTYDGFSLR